MSVTIECYRQEVDEFEAEGPSLNIANGNFRTVWSALGLDISIDLIGQIHPGELLLAVRRTSPGMIVRGERRGGGDGKAQWVECGISQDQAERYLAKLEEIAAHGIENGLSIGWW